MTRPSASSSPAAFGRSPEPDAGPRLSICCFRHTPTHVTEPALDAHNERILHALQRDGRAYLSNATIDGRFALRACITNFRTTRADVERVLAVVRALGG